MAFTLTNVGQSGAIPNANDLIAAIKRMGPQYATRASASTTDTISAYTLTGGLMYRSGASSAVAATTDTAANIITAIGPNYFVGMTFIFYYTNANTSAGAVTFTAGTGVTLAGISVVPIGTTLMCIGTVTSATTVTLAGQSVFTSVYTIATPTEVNTAITTVGAGTLTAAGIAGGLITRTGPTAAYTDTTDTAVAIVAAVANAYVGQSFELNIKNSVNFTETLAAGVGVTLSGITQAPPLTVLRLLVTFTSLTAVAIRGIGVMLLTGLPVSNYVTQAGSNQTATAGELLAANAANLSLTANSANAYTTRTGAEMAGDIPNIQIGQTWRQRILANGNNTVTLTAGASGVTITGTATATTGTYRDYVVTYTTTNTFVFQNIGGGSV